MIQCLPGVAQPFDHTLGKSCHFSPRSVVLQGTVCPVLVCSAVSVEVVGDFGKEGKKGCVVSKRIARFHAIAVQDLDGCSSVC